MRVKQRRGLFNTQRKAALVANIGPLLYPITKTQYQNASVPVPEQLFSHSDQQVCWQSPNADSVDRLGWESVVGCPGCLSIRLMRWN